MIKVYRREKEKSVISCMVRMTNFNELLECLSVIIAKLKIGLK